MNTIVISTVTLNYNTVNEQLLLYIVKLANLCTMKMVYLKGSFVI